MNTPKKKAGKHALKCGPSTKVQQHFKDESDINHIVRKMNQGQMPLGNSGQPQYLNLNNDMSYHDMLNQVTETKQAFDSLPAKIRGRFNNNPKNMVDFFSDKKNTEEAITLGLIPRPPEAEKTPVVINPTDAPKTSETPPEAPST